MTSAREMRVSHANRIAKSASTRLKTEARLRERAEEPSALEAMRRQGPRESIGEVLTERLSYAVRHPARYGTGLETGKALLGVMRASMAAPLLKNEDPGLPFRLEHRGGELVALSRERRAVHC